MSDEHTEQRNVPALIDTAQRPAVAAEYYYPTAGVEAPGTDWQRVLRLLWGRKWWIVLAFLVGTGGGIAAGRFGTKRVYEASMTIWLESQKQDDRRRGPIRAEEVFQGEGWKDVLRSFAVLEPVVIDQRVYLTPLEPKELPPGLFSNFSLLERIEPGKYELAIGRGGSWTLSRTDVGQVDSGKPGDTIGLPAGFAWKPEPGTLAKLSKIRFRLMTPRRAAAELRSHLNVFFDARASIITARLEGDDPDQIARLLNRIADRFIETATDLRSQNLREVVAFLGEQTSEAAEALSQAELAFENFKVETITLPTESPATLIPGIPSMSMWPASLR